MYITETTGRVRIFFGVLEDNNFVILNRFVKSTKKTPKSEIIQATKLLKRYKEEMDNEKKTKWKV